ncbi:hypothetical protein GmHk_15G045108 [Glycine max]|nr:hypothetical protein GmHk_15G045108 [Glycine max]
MEVHEDEAWGLLSAIKFVSSLDFNNVMFEFDSKGVVDKIRSSTTNLSELEEIIIECRSLLALNPTYVIGLAKRQ